MKEDILQDIPVEELPLLLNLCKERFGKNSIHITNFLKNTIDWKKRFPRKSWITVMAPNGDWKTHATFVADVQVPYSRSLVIFTMQKSNEELQTALLRTKRIDWSRLNWFAMVTDIHVPIADRIMKEFKLKLEPHATCVTNLFRLDIATALTFDYSSSSDDIYLAPLDPEKHADIINDAWPHSYVNSVNYIKAIIGRNASVGVFLRHNDELVAWIFHSFMGALASLQTLAGHQRKGYGALLTRTLAHTIAQAGWDSSATVVTTNAGSKKLFGELGFEQMEHTCKWICIDQ